MEIPLRNIKGEIVATAIVDEDDYERVSKMKWCAFVIKGECKYAQGRYGGKTISLHKFIIGRAPDDMVIDHKNRNGLDNRKCNLHYVTRSQNAQNKPKKLNTASKYMGVIPKYKKYECKCCKIYLGIFDNELEAAITYDVYAYITLGKHAHTNNLVTYEEAIQFTFEDILPEKTRKLPKYITYNKNFEKYQGDRTFNKVRYRTKYHSNIEDAEEELKIIMNRIENIKDANLEKHNNQEIVYDENNNAIIPLYDGNTIIVNKDIWHELMKYNWCDNGSGYAQTLINNNPIRMHQLVYKIYHGYIPKLIDHIDRNKSNNKIENLSSKTASENCQNKTKKENCSSNYVGVSYKKSRNKWESCIKKDGKYYYIGNYNTEIEAAKAYNVKATELYGENANLNNV